MAPMTQAAVRNVQIICTDGNSDVHCHVHTRESMHHNCPYYTIIWHNHNYGLKITGKEASM